MMHALSTLFWLFVLGVVIVGIWTTVKESN
jgi:hypothetical protein